MSGTGTLQDECEQVNVSFQADFATLSKPAVARALYDSVALRFRIQRRKSVMASKASICCEKSYR